METMPQQAAPPAPTPVSTAGDLDSTPLFARIATSRKIAILFTTSFIALAATFSSTSLFPATEEIAEQFGTTKEIINYSNAGIFIAMALSNFVWGPISVLFGRKLAYNTAIGVYFLFSLGAAVSHNLSSWVALRILAAFQASFFAAAGQSLCADIFHPANRGLAIGILMSGTITGPALGPCAGGIIVTYANWRAIFYLQAAMAGFGLVCALLSIPETTEPAAEVGNEKTIKRILSQFNPMRAIQLLVYPNVLLTDFACGLLSLTMYSLLTPPRYLINPRFHLTTPLVSGLFYLAPGGGFLIGVIAGGRWADITVKKWMLKRDGQRLAQDRMNSGILAFFFLVPVATAIYGWSLEFTVGGLAVPAVAMFFCGVGLMVAFTCLNTYTSEVMPASRTEILKGKYFIQYCCGAAGSAAVLPLINGIGIGLVSTISAFLVVIGGVMVLTTAKYGQRMQRFVDKLRKTAAERR
ncbi:synaptic vesicle transporter [Neofusicoccum parvum]|uniref:Synaptic vesicle transporter n=1 Tax=Neofusicoccum parvum TaxID=310453 RepID=A0ACB5RX63_9PEZI|nr:synaptic vesicle transporter [Neofusicoccum parvum]